MNRAYSLLTVKAVDDDKRVIEGVATTPEPDRVGDIINPLGAEFKNPLPLLWMHRHDQPVGSATFSKPTKEGIKFKASIAKVDEPGTLKDRLDEAWQTVKAGLVRAVSIGFKPLEYAFLDEGGMRFDAVEIMELSLVTIPAHQSATISVVKSLDSQLLAALGHRQKAVVQLLRKSPGASGPTPAGKTGSVKLIPR